MSADNGIYIAEFEDGFRVSHTQAIGNTSYPEIDHPRALKSQASYFKGESFDSEDKALEKAEELYQVIMDSSFPVIEYGIQKISFPHKYPKEHLKDN